MLNQLMVTKLKFCAKKVLVEHKIALYGQRLKIYNAIPMMRQAFVLPRQELDKI